MALKDSEMHLFAGLGSPLVVAALVALSMLTEKACASGGKHDDDDDNKEIVIEASLAAYKPEQKQPQKERTPEPIEKPEGVSSDSKQKPDKKKDEKKPDEKKHDITDFHHPTDDDNGPPTHPAVGDWNGAVNGDSAVSKGDPYIGKLKADMAYSISEISSCGDIAPVGCIRLATDGKIIDTKFKTRSNDDCQTAADAAVARLKKLRDDKPEEVPTHLLQLTQNGICFKFTVKQ